MSDSINTKPKIIAIFIAYKAARELENFYRSFPKELFDEIILVDDNSKDNTFELSSSIGIESYENPTNLGYGGNLKRALLIALQKEADIIVDIHPDGEYKPSAIVPAIEAIKDGSEFVLGNRFFKGHKPTENGMYTWKLLPLMMLGWISKVVLRLPIDDYHQGFRVYTRKLLEEVNFKANSNDYAFSIELLAQAAFYNIRTSLVPVEVSYTGDKRGASLKNSIIYSLRTLKVLFLYTVAKCGFTHPLFHKPPTT
ncbi:MAG: glycosyltransferase family 2 protein [Patescibacteria group bacterium]